MLTGVRCYSYRGKAAAYRAEFASPYLSAGNGYIPDVIDPASGVGPSRQIKQSAERGTRNR